MQAIYHLTIFLERKSAVAYNQLRNSFKFSFNLEFYSEIVSISKFTKTAGLAVAVGLTVLATNLNILFSPSSKINLTVL